VAAAICWLIGEVKPAFSQTWVITSAPTNLDWQSIACSADGTKIVAVSFGNPAVVYVSANSGSSWTSTVAPNIQFSPRVASSADGTKLVEAAFSDELGTSTNSGKTWEWTQFATNTALYGCIASSADGTRLAAANGYTSTNSGLTDQSFGLTTI
jgi:hypothetical protein